MSDEVNPQTSLSRSQTAPRRGRPPSLAARHAILAAAAALLDERGLGGVTVEAVAARARVGKPTIYRSWPNATALAMAALVEAPPPDTAVTATPQPLADLRRQLARVVAAFARPRGRQIAQMLASADADSELARSFRGAVLAASRTQGRALLHRAAATGALRAGVDIELALDLLYGPLFYRLLVGHAPLDAEFAGKLLDLALAGLAPPDPAA